MVKGKLKEKIAAAPEAPGVYLMKDAAGNVLYVGKAKSLKNRLASYLGGDLSTKTMVLMSQVNDLECRLAQSESLALLLEAALVHQYRPKYNVALRDDKSFPLVKITNEEFPVIFITRKRIPDGSCYFGPYTNAGLLREALKTIRRYFPYRSCRKLPKQACVYYRIGLSPAPCIGKISRQQYAQTIENISLLLEGKTNALISKLSRQMQEESGAHNFEAAAKIRDQIFALSAIGESRSGFSRQAELSELKKLLQLKRLPARIEAFDVSNIFGKEATGSMVSFYNGEPDKDNYRRFRVKTVAVIDDYSMLREVVQRRYWRLKEESLAQPDLILIDGGKGHLLAAQKELKALELSIPIASIAKDRENIYTPSKAVPIRMESDTPALNLIRRIRDEAHRFAVSYHHVLRRKKILGK